MLTVGEVASISFHTICSRREMFAELGLEEGVQLIRSLLLFLASHLLGHWILERCRISAVSELIKFELRSLRVGVSVGTLEKESD